MLLIVTGIAGLVGLAVSALWMGLLARRDPARTFRVRRSRFGPRVEVTYREWLRLVRWPAGLALACLVVGILTRDPR